MNDMVDMAQFVEAKSDQLNADDLLGGPRTITVTRVTGSDSSEQPVVIHFEHDGGKPFKPCKTMRRVLLGVWGKYASKDYPGRSMTIYRDDHVTFGGLEVGGIRISHVSHIDEPKIIVVNKTRGKKAGIKILPLKEAVTEDRAAQWLSNYLSALAQMNTPAEVQAHRDKEAKALAKLEKSRPDLFARAAAAYDAKMEGLSPGDDDDDDPFGDDPQTDDQPDDWSGMAADFLAEIKKARSAAVLGDVKERYLRVADAMAKSDKALCGQIEDEFTAKRAELEAK